VLESWQARVEPVVTQGVICHWKLIWAANDRYKRIMTPSSSGSMAVSNLGGCYAALRQISTQPAAEIVA